MSSGLPNWSGRRLAEARLAAGLTRDEFAELAGFTSTAVYLWERGKAPNPESLIALARAAGVATTDLAPMPDQPTLRDWREHAGLTLTALAKLLGVTHPTLSGIELRATHWPPYAAAWAAALGITEDQFRAAWQAITAD